MTVNEREAMVGLAAMALSADLYSYRALINGIPVPRGRLDPNTLRSINEPAEGEPITLDEELALRVEVSRKVSSVEEPPAADADASASTHTWKPLDLIELGAEPPAAPELGGLFYLGKRHVMSGEDDSGKTMLLAGISADELKAGHGVIWVDTDDTGPSMVLERLRGFGASDDSIRTLFAYLRPEEAINVASRDAVVELIRVRQARLMVHDAFNAALALHHYNPNASDEVEAFWQEAVAPFCRAGAAVVLPDHVVKNKENRGRYSYGSERKATGCDLHLGLHVIDPFGRGRRGRAKVTVHRDRVGFLGRSVLGEFVLDSDADTGRLTWRIEPVQEVDDSGQFRPTRLMERVSRYLELRSEPRPLNEIETDVTGNAGWLRKAVEALAAEGYAVEAEGPRGARLFSSILPFREDTEEAATE